MQCLYNRHLGVAQQVSRRFRHLPEETITDALLDVLIGVYQRIRNGRTVVTDHAHLRNYVRRALQNRLSTVWKNEQRLPFLYTDEMDFRLPAADADSDPEAAYWLANEVVARALQGITPECQKKLLWVADEMPYAEIAHRLNIEPNYIKQAVSACRKKLKAELLKLGVTVNWPKKKRNGTN